MSLPGRFLNVGGQRIFYHRAASGKGKPPLVLVHGYLLSHYAWRHVIPRLAQSHDVVAFDLPGFGESDRPGPTEFRYDAPAFSEALIGVLDALSLERVTLMGHSMGAGVSLYTAARRPERVDRLIAVDPAVYPFALPIEGRLVLLPYVGLAALRVLFTKGMVADAMRRDIYRDPSLVTSEWVDYVWERVQRPGGLEAMHAALRFLSAPDSVAKSVRAVRSPTLIVWGEDDRLFPSAWAKRLAADVAGSEVRIIPVCGHSPAEERPEELLRCVEPWLLGGAHKDMRAFG